MKLDTSKFNQIVSEAKSKTNDPKWLRAIDSAAEGILSGELIVTTLAHGALVTSANGSYMANGTCGCRAAQHGHKECRHRAAARLVELYETADEAVSSREEIVADIQKTWTRRFPGESLADELMARFRCNSLTYLNVDFLRRIQAAIA